MFLEALDTNQLNNITTQLTTDIRAYINKVTKAYVATRLEDIDKYGSKAKLQDKELSRDKEDTTTSINKNKNNKDDIVPLDKAQRIQ